MTEVRNKLEDTNKSLFNVNTRLSSIGNMLQINTEKIETEAKSQKKNPQNIQNIEKALNLNQKIAADNNEKISVVNQKIQLIETNIEEIKQKETEISDLMKLSKLQNDFVYEKEVKMMNENRTLINSTRKECEEYNILLIEKTNLIQENLNNFERRWEIRKKEVENFMMQYKMENSALCGKVEKIEEMVYNYNIHFNNINIDVNSLLQEVSNIKGRLDDNEEKYQEILKIIRKESIGMRKVTTEMINNRMNGTDQTLEIIIKKLGGLEKENAELREKLTEIQTPVNENSKEKSKKNQ
jgi:DNA repair ATPase RecN